MFPRQHTAESQVISLRSLGLPWHTRLVSCLIASRRGRQLSPIFVISIRHGSWQKEFEGLSDMLGDIRLGILPTIMSSGIDQICKIERLVETLRFRDITKKDSLLMLHGTPARNILSIMKHGLQLGGDSAVWVTNCLPTALTYATKLGNDAELFFFIVEVYIGRSVVNNYTEERGDVKHYNNELLILRFTQSEHIRLRYLVKWRCAVLR